VPKIATDRNKGRCDATVFGDSRIDYEYRNEGFIENCSSGLLLSEGVEIIKPLPRHEENGLFVPDKHSAQNK